MGCGKIAAMLPHCYGRLRVELRHGYGAVTIKLW